MEQSQYSVLQMNNGKKDNITMIGGEKGMLILPTKRYDCRI